MDVYGKLKGSASTEYKKRIGGNIYAVRVGMVNPNDLHLMPVDSNTKSGNPRFFTPHKSLLAKNPKHGPMTEQEQIDYFSKDDIQECLAGPLHKKTRQRFDRMKEGLKVSGESQDDIWITWDGGVIEGNNRTVIARLLNQEDNTLFKTVRVICCPPNVKPEDNAGMLIRRHVIPPLEWESGVQTMFLDILVESGMSAKDIAIQYNMSERKVKTLIDAGSLLTKYQKEMNDLRPEKFSIFLKVAGNTKLRNMLHLRPDGTASEAGEDALGGYDPEFLPRFYKWVKEDKVNGRNDMANMTSGDVGLLKYPHILSLIDEKGATEATNQLKLAGDSAKKKPGIQNMKSLISEMRKVTASQAEKLLIDKTYSNQLLDLHRELTQVIDRITNGSTNSNVVGDGAHKPSA